MTGGYSSSILIPIPYHWQPLNGRVVFPVAHSPLIGKCRREYSNAQVSVDVKQRRMFVMVQIDVDKDVENKSGIKEVKVVEIDRGISNMAVLSNNKFFNTAHLRNVKGTHRYNRKKLQHAGTRSARRKLRELSGRERRFVRDTNNVISKQIASLPFDVIALEDLSSAGMRKKDNGKRFNTLLGSWSPFQLEQFMEYKAEDMGKTVIYVNPRYTSQRCSSCGHIDKNNRNGSISHCLNCNLELRAHLNAARNIGILGKPEYFRLLSTSQS